jgi:hypothetical protein
MNTDRPPDTVRAYLDALQSALKGASPGLISDALADAEEHLRNEIASNPERSPRRRSWPPSSRPMERQPKSQRSINPWKPHSGPFPKSEQNPNAITASSA